MSININKIIVQTLEKDVNLKLIPTEYFAIKPPPTPSTHAGIITAIAGSSKYHLLGVSTNLENEGDLREYHQLSTDLCVLFEEKGAIADQMECNVSSSLSYYEEASRQLEMSKKYQRNQLFTFLNTFKSGFSSSSSSSSASSSLLDLSTSLPTASIEYLKSIRPEKSILSQEEGELYLLLESLSLEEYFPNFLSKQVCSVDTFAKLNDHELNTLGIPIGGLVKIRDAHILSTTASGDVVPCMTTGAQKKHVMISYSWNEASKPEHVKILSEKLKLAGIDVWRDETGSSILGKMEGNIDARMAKAVEMSSHIVICVSKDYPGRKNCEQEAIYANARSKQGECVLVFVMMQEDFTTVSREKPTGWLGMMIGSNLWYPAWRLSHLDDTAKKIVQLLQTK